jgi:GT2 family glycosyltransferase
MRRPLLSRVRRKLALRTRLQAARHPELWAAARRDQPKSAPASRDVVRVLKSSTLFDVEWYARISGCEAAKEAAVRHYLARGRRLGLPPHPLFDPDYFASQHAAVIGERDPLAYYLSEPKSRKASPHPLFDVASYVAATPAAKNHPLGPLGHYLEAGAARGLRPNDWYVPDPQTEPRGLIDWIEIRAAAWAGRARAASASWQATPPVAPPADEILVPLDVDRRPHGDPERPLVSVVLVVGDDPTLVPDMVRSVVNQTVRDWELLVVHARTDTDPATDLGLHADDPRVRVLRPHVHGDIAARNLAMSEATGGYLAWISAGDRWAARRLELALAGLRRPGVDAILDVLELMPGDDVPTSPGDDVEKPIAPRYFAVAPSPERIAAGWHPELAALVVRRELAVEVGGFDASVHRAAAHDFFLKVAARTAVTLIPTVGVTADAARRSRDVAVLPLRERPSLDVPGLETWHDVVLSRHLVPWDALAFRAAEPGTPSVVIPTVDDWRLTTAAVRSVVAAAEASRLAVRTIVLNNGSGVTASVVLDSLPLRFPGVRVVSMAVNHGFALGNNLALEAVEGEVVVFLNNDAEVRPGWLEPLITALDEPKALGAQSLLVYPSGSIQSAGIAFPACGGIPHVLLQGFPVEDAVGLGTARFSALTAAAMAMRVHDFVRFRGFDPLYRNGMEDVDLGLRMTDVTDGHFVVRPESVVVHHESQTPGRFGNSLNNRRILLDRWRDGMPADDVRLWRHVGFDVIRHEVGRHVSEDRRITPPQPVLRRRPVISAIEPELPVLRWAIKNPAPNDASAEFWGDTHFARQLADALRALGQQVVIDHRPGFDRPSGRFDDVVVVLRGLAPYRPQYTQVNLGWLISHPDMLRRDEASSYDRLFAASVRWADEISGAWGIRVDPLLQATDPRLFHPDRARPDTGHPVLFVGSSRRKVRPMVRDAIDAGLPLAVFGREWEGLVPDGYVKAEYLPNEEVGAAYRAAGIVLNDHWDDMRLAGFLSNRLFDAVASGGRVITDDVVGLGDLFGRSVQVARDRTDLVRLASGANLDEVFGDDNERRSVAARIHAEHSFDARARELLATAVEIRCRLTDRSRDDVRAPVAIG